MDILDADAPDFDAHTYLRMLVAIAKSDRDNGPRELAYIKQKAQSLGEDLDDIIHTTDKCYSIEKQKVSRLTALMILRDAIGLASMDRNFSLPERQRIYTYAEKLDIARKDVDALEVWVKQFNELSKQWHQLVVSA